MEQLLDFIDIGLDNIENALRECNAKPEDFATLKYTLPYIKAQLEEMSDNFTTIHKNTILKKYDDETVVEGFERILILASLFADAKESYGRIECWLLK